MSFFLEKIIFVQIQASVIKYKMHMNLYKCQCTMHFYFYGFIKILVQHKNDKSAKIMGYFSFNKKITFILLDLNTFAVIFADSRKHAKTAN